MYSLERVTAQGNETLDTSEKYLPRVQTKKKLFQNAIAINNFFTLT